ncbi:methyl farnesoate epoxidase-like isoform X1 [Hylaeus volcanicus]|uniref:methyl farnesoate epoxidase-like isoform X1 n=1 Tax=Hylaeus volcanicus TaxID=313075 RepID=UPI0023B86CF6|nr:methyl farnesoate epoxidase-like isoform X1 [Hylaeus volcanicus]
MLCAAISLLLVLFCAFCLYDCLKPRNFPPGPKWLPLVGCFLGFRRLRAKNGYAYLAFQELTRTYGPILGLKLGNQKVVVISTHDLVKKVLLRDEFNGRPDGFFFRVRSFGKRKGILFTEGPRWSQCRRFTMRHLRMFGLGQSVMEKQLTIEAENLVRYLRRASAKAPVPMHTAFDIAVLNSLWSMFAGHRFDYENEKLTEMLETVHDAFRLMDTMGGIVSQIPFLRFVIPELCGYNELMRILRKLWSFLDEEISVHEKRLSSNEPQDLIEAFLLEISSNDGKRSETIFDRENLLVLCLDLFLAGSKTTTDTLATTLLFLSLHSEWIKTLRDELDNVVGRSRAPALEDYPSMPLMESFLAEVQRFLILAPLGVPHKTMEDVTLNEYRIPKDTIVLLDFHSVHNDEAYWDRPHEFRPQRFLDESGRFSQKNASMPFGLGKRRCPGEMLARSSLFLFFAYVIHYFDIEISPDHDKPDPNGYDGFTISPKPYYLKLATRPDIASHVNGDSESIVSKFIFTIVTKI